jgi:hypothetical protein
MTGKRDNQIIQIFLPIIQNGLVAAGYENVIVKQSNQPTQQGVPTTATVFFFKVSNKRYGFLGRYDQWIIDQMVHHESQYMEITFQVSSLVLQYPITPNQYTASDLVNEVAAIMQSDNTREILNNNGIGILRVMEIQNPYFIDDRDQFEASPFFQFTLVYRDDRVSTNPIIDEYDYNILTI